jgi:hypothetical protein
MPANFLPRIDPCPNYLISPYAEDTTKNKSSYIRKFMNWCLIMKGVKIVIYEVGQRKQPNETRLGPQVVYSTWISEFCMFLAELEMNLDTVSNYRCAVIDYLLLTGQFIQDVFAPMTLEAGARHSKTHNTNSSDLKKAPIIFASQVLSFSCVDIVILLLMWIQLGVRLRTLCHILKEDIVLRRVKDFKVISVKIRSCKVMEVAGHTLLVVCNCRPFAGGLFDSRMCLIHGYDFNRVKHCFPVFKAQALNFLSKIKATGHSPRRTAAVIARHYYEVVHRGIPLKFINIIMIWSEKSKMLFDYSFDWQQYDLHRLIFHIFIGLRSELEEELKRGKINLSSRDVICV